MKADPFAQLKLLDIAEIDARILQLRHQLKNLPETKQIAELQVERKKVDDVAIDLRIKRDDLTLAQTKAEKDVEASAPAGSRSSSGSTPARSPTPRTSSVSRPSWPTSTGASASSRTRSSR